MSIAIVILIFTMLSAVSFAYDKEVPSRDSQVLHFFPSKEPQDQGYIEQCRSTNLLKGYLARVNVFAFINPSWYYSYRQTVMLQLLKKRLEKSDFSDTLFFVVTPRPGLPEDNTDNDIETNAFKEISKHMQNPEYFWVADKALFNEYEKNSNNGIIHLQDTPELRIWERFRGSKDEVVILDQCGKLTYQIMVPWSILYFPYVKAAILCTYKEDPCGPCNERSTSVHNLINHLNHISQKAKLDEKEVYKNVKFKTEEIPITVELENVTMSSGELKETEENITNSPYTNVTTNKITIPDTKVTNTSSIDTETFPTHLAFDKTYQVNETTSTENTKNNENVNTTINDKLNLTITNAAGTDRTSSDEYQHATDINLKNIEEKEEMSSVAPMTLEQNIEDSEMSPQEKQDLPLRITMYAPHLHKEGEQSRQYTHLVLKTGSPDYHGHFHSLINIYGQQPIASDITMLENRKMDKYVNGENESPGVYGEIYDYWRSTEEGFSDKSENADFNVDNDNIAAEDTHDEDSNVLRPSDVDIIESDTKIDKDSEDFAQRKLIEHYNKLVPWIYYVL